MTRQAFIRSLFGRGVYPLLGVIVDLRSFASKASILMIIFDSVAVAEVKNHRIGGRTSLTALTEMSLLRL
jgi:hypothetical protein